MPAKMPVVLAIVSAVIVPLSAFAYAGFYAMNLAGLLSIFSTVWIVLDVLLAFLCLLFTWANVRLLHAVLCTLPELSEKRIMSGLWKCMAYFAGALSILTPLYSIFPNSPLAMCGWAVVFCLELLASIALGCLLMRFASQGRNTLLFAMAFALALSCAFHFGGFRIFQSAMDRSIAVEQRLSEEPVSGENLLFSFWGLSPAELDNLDDESLADIQEVSLGVAMGLGLCFAGMVLIHSASAVVFYVLMALYLARKNASCPGRKRRHLHFNQQEVQAC